MKNHYFFAPMIGVDETRGSVQFCFLAKNQDAEQVDADLLSAKLQAFAFMGAADSPGEKGAARFVDGSIQAKSDRVAFSMKVHDGQTLKMLKGGVLQGALVRAHTRPSGELTIDGVDFRDNSDLRLEKYTHLAADEGYSFAKNSIGIRRVGIPGMSKPLTIGKREIPGGDVVIKTGAQFMDLVKGFRKTSESNRDHLMHAHTHLEKAGEHLAAAQKRYAFDNNIRGAVKSHADAMECMAKIDLPDQNTIPSPSRPSSKPEPADANERGQETFRGPIGRWGGPTTGARPDPDVVTSHEPGRKMSRADANDAFAKAFTPEGRARSRRSLTFHR